MALSTAEINDMCEVENFVTWVFSFILNTISANLWYENENKHMHTDTFDIHE